MCGHRSSRANGAPSLQNTQIGWAPALPVRQPAPPQLVERPDRDRSLIGAPSSSCGEGTRRYCRTGAGAMRHDGRTRGDWNDVRYRVSAYNTATASTNKIHDDAVARKLGFRGGLVPGVDVYAYLCHLPAERWGRAWLERGNDDGPVRCPRLRRRRRRGRGDIVGEWRARADPERLLRWPVCDRSGGDARRPTDPARPRRLAVVCAAARTAEGQCGDARRAVRLHRGHVPGGPGRRVPRRRPRTLALFRDERVAHPGWLLRFANYVLTANVRMGPWIHVESTVQFFGVVSDGDRLVTRALVTGERERRGSPLRRSRCAPTGRWTPCRPHRPHRHLPARAAPSRGCLAVRSARGRRRRRGARRRGASSVGLHLGVGRRGAAALGGRRRMAAQQPGVARRVEEQPAGWPSTQRTARPMAPASSGSGWYQLKRAARRGRRGQRRRAIGLDRLHRDLRARRTRPAAPRRRRGRRRPAGPA